MPKERKRPPCSSVRRKGKLTHEAESRAMDIPVHLRKRESRRVKPSRRLYEKLRNESVKVTGERWDTAEAMVARQGLLCLSDTGAA